MADRHIDYYTIGHLYGQEICFPEDNICCRHCHRAYKDSLGRMKCGVLDRLIFDGNARWDDCPIEFNGEIRGMRKEKS